MTDVRELMTADPATLDPEAKIEEAWKLMHSERVRHVPVCKGDKLVGLVTQKDLLVNAQNTSLLSLPVAEIMVFDVQTVDKDLPAALAAKRMIDEKISCLPVVENGELVGIVTDSDFLNLVIKLLAN
ncbi:MAG: CBS domain-containing protein [Pseudomonadales bacterium]|jgi:CBS domain-containing protein|nr:CBS domain-containing protein [Pseudomonadales bacterium]